MCSAYEAEDDGSRYLDTSKATETVNHYVYCLPNSFWSLGRHVFGFELN